MAKTQKTILTIDDVKHVIKLANVTVPDDQIPALQTQLEQSLEYVSALKKVNTQGVPETNQVAGLTNVLREDAVDESRMFSQGEALKNAKRQHNGYFVVKAILE